MADHSMGAAAQTLCRRAWILTAELKTSLLRAGRGERLGVRGAGAQPGRSISFTEASVWPSPVASARW